MKRIALRVLIVSVAISAILGVYAILAGNFGSFEVKVLFTSVIVSVVSIHAMACGVAAERRVLPPMPLLGVWIAVLGGGFATVGLWAEFVAEEYWKLTVSIAITATAFAHASLVALANLARRFRWAQPVAYGLAALLAASLIFVICLEADDNDVARFIAVVSILLAAATIALPVFHRMSRMDGESGPAAIRFCPMCGASLSGSLSQCDACHARFSVEVLEQSGSLDAEDHRSTETQNRH